MVKDADDGLMLQNIKNTAIALKQELHKQIVGNDATIDDLLCCLLAGGHCLLIGVPGLAKTLLVASCAQCLDLSFNRIQFTPDLMPSDITGSEILFEDKPTGRRELKFIKGPVFSNIVLADEINRTPPKTQSALLQAMQEYEVTSAGQTYPLQRPFWVLATQNPIEQEGTYPLPEAQQDRFMFSLYLDYPDRASEIDIVKQTTRQSRGKLSPVVNGETLLNYTDLVFRVPVPESTVAYAVSLCRATRPGSPECPEKISKLLRWGAGPRASQHLILAAKAYAVLDGRPTADKQDVFRATLPVLRHRLVRSFNAEADDISTEEIIGQILAGLPHTT
ncbi:MAG: MoxR family ATPase [Chitinivibrionales bacterium]|nr:MoxR family ATPase [Chitinivibrionales bacterium]